MPDDSIAIAVAQFAPGDDTAENLADIRTLATRAAARTRPLPPVIARVQAHFPRIWAIDGSTLEELFKKVGLQRPAVGTVLGGTLEAVLDVATKLPVMLWLDPDPAANDKRFVERIKALLTPGTLLVLDAGYYAFPWFDWLTERLSDWLTECLSPADLRVWWPDLYLAR